MRYVFLIALFLFLGSGFSYGQIAVRVFSYHPTGEFGFAMKPLVSGEVSYQYGFSKRSTKRWRAGFSLVLLNLKPRMEVFPVYGVLSDGAGTRVIAGQQSFQRYFIAQLCGGSDFAFVHKEKINLYAGADIVVGGASVDYTSVYPGLKGESYSGGGILGGFRARVGAEYSFSDHFSAFANAHRSVFLITEPASIPWAYDFGVGVRYSFE